MTDQPTTDLDSFETALLAELQEELRKSASPAPLAAPAPWGHPRAPHRKRWVAVAAAVTVAATLVIATEVPGIGPTPAYAVTGRNNGEVIVQVNRLEGAEGLEQALRRHGIATDITYLPSGKTCAPARYTQRRTPGMMLGVALNWFEVTIPPGAVGKDDTFVLSAAVVPIPHGFQATTEFGIAQGPVKPCEIIDSP